MGGTAGIAVKNLRICQEATFNSLPSKFSLVRLLSFSPTLRVHLIKNVEEIKKNGALCTQKLFFKILILPLENILEEINLREEVKEISRQELKIKTKSCDTEGKKRLKARRPYTNTGDLGGGPARRHRRDLQLSASARPPNLT